MRHGFRLGLFLQVALLVTLCLPSSGVRAAPPDLAIPSGHFYSQAGHDSFGFVIADGGSGKFWTSFQSLGGVDALGYPASFPYQKDGFSYQATQGAILQWRPEQDRAILANTFEQFTTAGDDELLYKLRQIPRPIQNDGSGGSFDQAVAIRLGWLTDHGIAERYRGNPNPAQFSTWSIDDSIQLYGLPMSRPESFGPFVSQRFQRIAFQRWVQPVTGMPAPGSVVRVLGGDLAKELSLVPKTAQQPRASDATSATPVPSTTGTGDLDHEPTPVGIDAPSVPVVTGTVVQPVAPINLFPLAPCRPSAIVDGVSENYPGKPAPEAGTIKVYGQTAVKLEHNDNCWDPVQLKRLRNHRDIADITEVVIHWTGIDYERSARALRRGVSVHYLVPRAYRASQPTLELIDPRNAAWHAGPLNKTLWDNPTHRLCYSSKECDTNGNVHSIGFENEGDTEPNEYQIGIITDVLAGLIKEGYPIQLDRQHVVGHREINSHKEDPGDLDINRVISIVRQKLAPPVVIATAIPSTPTPASTPTPLPPVANGTSARPYMLTGATNGTLTGGSGGAYTYYTIPQPAGNAITITFAYTGIAAPPGSVGAVVFQGQTPLGTVSPAGQTGGSSLAVTPRAGVPLLIQVFSYIPQPVRYDLVARAP